MAVESALNRVLAGLPTLFGDGVKVAIATALLYFWGIVYLSSYATRFGLPFDMLSVPVQQVIFAPWETVDYFVTDTLAFFPVVALLPIGIRFLSYVGHAVSGAIARQPVIQAQWERLHPRGRGGINQAAKSAEDEAFESTLRIGLFRALTTMSVLALLYAGTAFADRKGTEYAAKRLNQECRPVSVVTSTGPMVGPAEFCARFGDDFVFRINRAPALQLVKASDIRSVTVAPAPPKGSTR